MRQRDRFLLKVFVASIIISFAIPPWQVKCSLPSKTSSDYYNTGSICFQDFIEKTFLGWRLVIFPKELPANESWLIEEQTGEARYEGANFFVGVSYKVLVLEWCLVGALLLLISYCTEIFIRLKNALEDDMPLHTDLRPSGLFCG